MVAISCAICNISLLSGLLTHGIEFDVTVIKILMTFIKKVI